MSTQILDFLDEIQGRIPENKIPDFFPALNQAIRAISRRLYKLDSGLVKGNLSIPIYAEDSYAAATIAFVDGGPDAADTITDSAVQFVVEGFSAGMAITTTCTGNTGPFRITAVAAGTITLHAEDSVVAQAVGSSYTITSDDEYGYLPDDFGGLVENEKPYVDGYTYGLLPLPSQETKLKYTSAGVPNWYQIKGSRFYVTPPTSADITIRGDYWQRTVRKTKVSEYLPFNGVFDDVIGELVVRILDKGIAEAGAELDNFIASVVDPIVQKQGQKAPVHMPCGINWGF
ncbi:MAG: hypothetical protein LLG06_19815 [Desulfobacteraceae bacterium]|nr:hypothetical protein [Desulfobacteraceae bacterium]